MMQKFIIPPIHKIPGQVTIQGQDAKHISRVLRLKPGNSLSLTDGCGRDYQASITAVSKNGVQADVTAETAPKTESTLEITLCSGMLKDKKMDFIIKHVTQLGIVRWIPFFCRRSVPSPSTNRIEKRIQRWEAIARESLKQCRRSCLPIIAKPVDFQTLLNQSDAYDLKIAFWENAAQKLNTLKTETGIKSIIILIGPEGGFTTDEIDQAENHGFSSFLLGPRILRAETASISSCTLAQHILGDI